MSEKKKAFIVRRHLMATKPPRSSPNQRNSVAQGGGRNEVMTILTREGRNSDWGG